MLLHLFYLKYLNYCIYIYIYICVYVCMVGKRLLCVVFSISNLILAQNEAILKVKSDRCKNDSLLWKCKSKLCLVLKSNSKRQNAGQVTSNISLEKNADFMTEHVQSLYQHNFCSKYMTVEILWSFIN